MKLQNIYKLFFLLFLAFVFQSRSGGPGAVANLEVTGAPGSTGNAGTCGNTGCHTSGSFNPSLDISFTDQALGAVDVYQPGVEYLVDVQISSAETVPRSGMQMVALDANGASIGSWTFLPLAAQMRTLSGREYVEHNSPLDGLTWEFNWTAPETGGNGQVTFYAAGLASNNNGSTQGDGVATNSITILEEVSNSTLAVLSEVSNMELFPNPITNNSATLAFNSIVTGEFELNVLNTLGQKVHSEFINVQNGDNQKILDLKNLQGGLYFVQLTNEGRQITQQLVKL